MKIIFESELMENQKHAEVMVADRAFEVLQSQDGDALFFSIGSDDVFYLTREVTQTSTGWNRIDLSSNLSAQHAGAVVAAKSFSVTQNPQTLGIDLALVLTVGGADLLYLSLGNANTDDSWAGGAAWTVTPFDAVGAPTPLIIADVLMLNIPADGGDSAIENIVVDVLRTPGDPLALLNRYYIVPGGSPQWNLHVLAADLAAGSISSCLGRRTNDPVSGIYTFGAIDNEAELLFTPTYNFFRPGSPPSPARLTLPAGASAVASALNGSGVSNLFVAAAAGLFLFTPDNQHDQAAPVQIVTNDLVAGAAGLAAATAGNHTTVWGLDPQGSLFYVTCPAGSEADATAWSVAVPLVTGVEGFAFFLNLDVGYTILFAHLSGQNLVQLSQDPVTTDWQQRAILLPTTSVADVAVFNSFTTHVQVTDDDGVVVPNIAVAVTATSPVSVYLNDVYYRLSTTVPVNTAADATGVLTIVQATESLSGVCFQVRLSDGSGVTAEVNPMSKAMTTLSGIHNGDDLGAVQVTNADGSQQPLVPVGVSSGDKAAAANSLVQFVRIGAGLPQNGSRQSLTGSAVLAAVGTTPMATVPSVWGITFAKGGLEYHEGVDTAQRWGLRAAAAGSSSPGDGLGLQSVGTDLELSAGDFFRWVVDVLDEVESFVVREAEGIYHFLAQIGDEVYDVLLDCVNAVAHAVEFVFNKIKVFFEDLIKWLGFIFEWADILRTHRVLKNAINQYLAKSIDSMATIRGQVQDRFTAVGHYIDAWAGIPDNIPPSLSGAGFNGACAIATSNSVSGQNSPQSNWGLHHLKSNAANGSTSAQPNAGVVGDVLSVLQPLIDALEREQAVFQSAYCSFKGDVIDKIQELSFAELIESVMAIIADALLESVENVLLAAIDVLIALSEGVLDGLNETIDIPVISWLYKKVAGQELSLLDVTCLVAAIPVTLGFKLTTNMTPFPDTATTSALIHAPDFAAIQKICNSGEDPQDELAGMVTLDAGIARDEGDANDTSVSPGLNKILVLTAGIASAVGAVSVSFFAPLKQKFPATKVFSVLNGLSYLLYVAPDIFGQLPDLQNKQWWALTNETITDLMVVKSMVDMGVGLTTLVSGNSTPTRSPVQGLWDPVSPWLDFAGNLLWQVPTTAAVFDPENQNTTGVLNFAGGTCFDCNGILSPALADDDDPISWGMLVAAATVFNLAYGSMSCAASVLSFEG